MGVNAFEELQHMSRAVLREPDEGISPNLEKFKALPQARCSGFSYNDVVVEIAEKAFVDIMLCKRIDLPCGNDDAFMLVDGIRAAANANIGFSRREVDEGMRGRAGRRDREPDQPDQILDLHDEKCTVVGFQKSVRFFFAFDIPFAKGFRTMCFYVGQNNSP